MKKKTTNAFMPRLNTPRSIADDSKVHVSKIWSVIFCHNIQPTAMADETPCFNEASAKAIVKLAKKVTK